ncbi:MAG: OmpA family protein [Leptospiraceae bacterium]|nr:OmpA family protein [Leptospiraceae bacterium]
MKRAIAITTLTVMTLSFGARCATLDKLGWNTIIGTGIGCTAGLAIGAIYDEVQRKKENKDRKKLENAVYGIFKERKKHNQGKIIGLATGCLAGLGVGAYLDIMKEDMEDTMGDKGISLESVKGPDGETDELLVKMDGDISFDTGSAGLQGVAKENVAKLSAALEGYPETQIKIWGHTDYTGSRAVNDALSLRRAQSVQSSLDISSSRIAEVRGFAWDRPVNGGTPSPGANRANRRVEVRIIADKSAL